MIDIVTPTFNSEKYLEWTILSTRLLRERGARHVVVDSFSNDKTQEIAACSSVPVILCPPGNMYQAINMGLSSGEREWCCYINSDDLIYSQCFLGALAGVPKSVDILYGDIDYIDSLGRYLHSWRCPPPFFIAQLIESGFMPFPQQGMMFRRNVFEQLSGFNQSLKYSADFDFVVRALGRGFKFAKYSSGPTAAFRIHAGQLSQSCSMAIGKEVLTSLAENSYAKPSFFDIFKRTIITKTINLDSYLVRSLRKYFINGKISMPKTISS
jgi:glycosyltransferase involved in cell wall biosynthesis